MLHDPCTKGPVKSGLIVKGGRDLGLYCVEGCRGLLAKMGTRTEQKELKIEEDLQSCLPQIVRLL
jgi:hypothetical protein